MDNVLQKILAEKKKEVERLKQQPMAIDARTPLSLKRALLSKGGLAVIAEMKRHSPSKGTLNEEADPAIQARIYENAGAAAISILTDRPFFKGDFQDIKKARDSVSIPILCKDFIIDRIQIDKAASVGADAILLIVAALPVEGLKDLFGYAKERGLDVLVEVHDEEEMQTAIELGADIVGVNNRNLADFSVSLETTVRLAANIPEHVVLVSESGIRSSRDAEQVRVAGAKAILVGEALMKAADPSAAIKEFSISRTGAG